MIAGIAAGSVAEARIHNKVGFSPVVQYSILAFAVLLVVWNCIMYKVAFTTPENEFSPSKSSRMIRPITATVSFLVGLTFLFW